MSLKNLMQPQLVACGRNHTIKEAAQLMVDQNVGAVLIVEEEKPVGILTDRDLVVRCVVQGHDCAKTVVGDIMTQNPQSVKATDGIFDVIGTMQENKVRRIPVVDEEGKAIGLVSFGDIFQLLSQEMQAMGELLTPETPKLVSQEKSKVAA